VGVGSITRQEQGKMNTDRIRVIYAEALNAETVSARIMAWNAGDNAGATCSENGQEAWDAGGNHTDDFMFWWMQSIISILSDDNNAEAHAYYAERGITA
jgi:hypothetical protein